MTALTLLLPESACVLSASLRTKFVWLAGAAAALPCGGAGVSSTMQLSFPRRLDQCRGSGHWCSLVSHACCPDQPFSSRKSVYFLGSHLVDSVSARGVSATSAPHHDGYQSLVTNHWWLQDAPESPARPGSGAKNGDAAADDDDGGDIFAEDEDGGSEGGAVPIDGAAEAPVHDDRRDARQAEGFRKANTGLSDMYDDSQGYYNFRVGELMGGRCVPARVGIDAIALDVDYCSIVFLSIGVWVVVSQQTQ